MVNCVDFSDIRFTLVEDIDFSDARLYRQYFYRCTCVSPSENQYLL